MGITGQQQIADPDLLVSQRGRFFERNGTNMFVLSLNDGFRFPSSKLKTIGCIKEFSQLTYTRNGKTNGAIVDLIRCVHACR